MRRVARVWILAFLLLGLLPAHADADTTVTFTAPDQIGGLLLRHFDDGLPRTSAALGTTVVQTSSAGNLYFDVDDVYIRNGSATAAVVEVEYFDHALLTGRSFWVQYDSTSNAYWPTERVVIGGTNQFKIARFYLDQVRFDNQQMGADFRIVDERAGLMVRRVTVQRATSTPQPISGGTTAAFVAPDQNGGLVLRHFDDGLPITSAALGIPVVQTSSAGNLYFDVDDNYIRNGSYPTAILEVEYFDHPDLMGWTFYVQYDATSNAYRPTERVFITGTSQFKVARFYLDQVRFDNQQLGADFRIADERAGLMVRRVTVQRTTSTPQPISGGTTAAFVAPDQNGGLLLRHFDDGLPRTSAALGMPVVQTSSAGNLYFDVDDNYIRNGSYRSAVLEVEYYDQAQLTGRSFYVQYDAMSSGYAPTERVVIGGTNQFKIARFSLDQVRFDNQQQGADFRIVDERAGLMVRRVTVQRVEGATPAPPQTPAPAFGGASSVGFQAPATASGLTLRSGGDGVTTPTSDHSRTAVRVSPQGRAYFDVDDSFAKEGTVSEVSVTVSYFDQGYGTFTLHYDSTSSLAASAEVQAHWPAAGLSSPVATNNVVWLTNSRTWKTTTFNLTNVRFGNRQLNAQADFRIAQEVGSEYQAANDGYLLAIDSVTVARPARTLDRGAGLAAAGAGGGLPLFVWTRLAETNEGGHGLYQNEAAAPTTPETIGGEQARKATSGMIVFDVNDTYIKNGNARDVLVAVEYFDNGTGDFYLQYDSTSEAHRVAATITRSNRNQWRRATFYLSDAYFSNAMAGGSDFALVASGRDLYVRAIYVGRAAGTGLAPNDAPSDVAAIGPVRDRAIATLYYPIYDGRFPAQWERSSMGPPGVNAQRIAPSYSWRDADVVRKDFADMRAAQIDAALIWYNGNSADGSTQAVPALRSLVAAAQSMERAPSLGLLLDPQTLYGERVFREPRTPLDLTDQTTVGLLIKAAQDFYSQVPRERWFTLGGRPVVLLLYRGSDIVSRYDQTFFERLRARFAAAFGVPPYLIVDTRWEHMPASVVDDWYRATPGLSSPTQPGYVTAGVVSLGPGFDDGAAVNRRLRDREGGAFYERGWQRALSKGVHLAVLDSWNHWSDGTAIAESAEHGRAYVEATARLATAFKSIDYRNAARASTTLGELNTSQGLSQDEIEGSATTTGVWSSEAGRRARGTTMVFSVHDDFLFNRPARVRITVRYFDADPTTPGAEWFSLVYDSTRGPSSMPEPSATATVYLTGSRTWKSYTWELPDALFANRQAGANDFRLEGSGALIVNEVTVALVNRVYAPAAQRAP
ncbi:MAG: DUF5010 domain-containing protein [Chloroflexi bacterium]|nr:DUF5010 domain-containing protein [Chloroflexota bacterium]